MFDIKFTSVCEDRSLDNVKPIVLQFLNFLISNCLKEGLNYPLVNCLYRSSDSDIKKGRSGQSAHCKGLAVDLHCPDSRVRAYYVCMYLLFVTTLFEDSERCRIGIYKSFVHFDFDFSKVYSIWLG